MGTSFSHHNSLDPVNELHHSACGPEERGIQCGTWRDNLSTPVGVVLVYS